MRKNLVLCLTSAAIGALLAVSVGVFPRLIAQERFLPAQRSEAGPRLEDPRFARAAPPPVDELTPDERVNVAVYEACNRSVVNINTKGVSGEHFFFMEIPQEGAGSGSVLDKHGHILTNYHVIEGAKEIEVTLFDGNSYPARLIGRDAPSDIAVLRIDAPVDSLYPVQVGDSSRLKVGQKVFAIGNPFGLERTLTTGVISSLNRSLPARGNRTMKSIIQIDAAINPGNSGGPLLDTHGRLIGMNTAIASKSGQSSGVGFAVAAINIARVVPQLIQQGKVSRPETGISRVYQTERGLLVAAMLPGGPAEKAGLRGFKVVKQKKRQGPFNYEFETVDRSAADLIVAVNGEKTITADDFLGVVEARQPGEEVVLTVVRDNREVAVSLRLTTAEQ